MKLADEGNEGHPSAVLSKHLIPVVQIAFNQLIDPRSLDHDKMSKALSFRLKILEDPN